MKILVTGARGLLGSEFVRAAGRRGLECVALGRAELDVTDADACATVIAEYAPDWVVHCAAYTAVDRAEEESEIAYRVNGDGSGNVARAAVQAGARTVYISSDYVYPGHDSKPYKPGDPTGPQSVYAQSKLAGERAVLDAYGGGGPGGGPLVVRTGWLYGSGGHNFVEAILARARSGKALSVVQDQRGRPTWARNVAETVLALLGRDVEGVWHVADGGEATWLDFAREAVRLEGLDVSVAGVSTEEWGAAAPRPSYSVLELAETERELGRPAMEWREALGRYLTEDRGVGGAGVVTSGGR